MLGLHCCTCFSPVVARGHYSSCDAQASRWSGFFVSEHGLEGTWAAVVAALGLSSCGSCALEHRLSSWGSCALEHRLSSWGSRAQLLYSMWNLPRPRMEPISLALAGRFFTTVPPGKPLFSLYYFIFNYTIRCLLILQLSNSGDIIKTWKAKKN